MKDQKSRDCVKGITFAVSLLVVSACTSQTVVDKLSSYNER
jgi:hypothetical protein